MKSIDVTRTLLFALFGGFVCALPVQAGYLNCSKARSNVERLICDERKNPGLYSLDSTLNILYEEAVVRAEGAGVRGFSEEQKKWLKNVRNVCNDAECLRKVYKTRIDELQGIATLCKSHEVIIFSCTLTERKVVSVCASPNAGPNTGYMQFRWGRNLNSLEIEFPKERTPAKKHFKHIGDDSSDTHAISFWSGANRFSVFDTKANLAVYNHAGLIVSSGHPPVRVSYSECTKPPVVLSGNEHYSALRFRNMNEWLGLPDAGNDISYATGEVELQPGELEEE